MIIIRGISKSYPNGKLALDNVCLNLNEGMFGLLGPNGAGKSTLISILALTLEPTLGTWLYNQLDPKCNKFRNEIRRMLGYLPQQFNPIPSLTGFEYLHYCARLRGVNFRNGSLRRHIEELLDIVGLTNEMHRRTSEYSGGMKRRVGLAQALLHDPSILLLDEPTAGLDPEERIVFRGVVSEKANKACVLLSTHIVEDIEATCSEVAIISNGTVQFCGNPSEIIRRAKSLHEPNLEQSYLAFLSEIGGTSYSAV
jgi:ABC-2 type transport system ATP-binding protein